MKKWEDLPKEIQNEKVRPYYDKLCHKTGSIVLKRIFDILVGLLGEGTITIVLKKTLSILKYPIVITILYLNIKLMYVIAPDKEIPSKSTKKGAMFTTLGWVLATEIFAFYIEKFARYDIFYGSISNILVLLLWVYLLSYIFVLGMVINAGDYKGELE